MHKARSFFFVAAGIFLLALAFHLGAMTATAQPPSNPVVTGWESNFGGQFNSLVVASNGDVYYSDNNAQTWTLRANVFGGPTPASQPTWGQLKAKYRHEGTATQDNK
jgi:hypothetical protein